VKKGDIIELQTINKKGFLSFQRLKITDARVMKKKLTQNGYHETAGNTYFCSHQYD